MKIAIVDDLYKERKLLYDYLSTYCTDQHIHAEIYQFEDGTDFLIDFNKGIYDLIFLDIYMKDMDGITVAQEIRDVDEDCIIIFSTSSESHAVKGFWVRAFDYLVKPYTYEQFAHTMDLCKQSISNLSRFIEVKEGRCYTKILLRDIIYTDYYNHYIQIHTKTRLIRSYMPFAEFSPTLEIYPQFLCCYRNCLVNMDEVEALDDRDFIMKNGERVPISKKIKSEVRQIYADYVFHCISRGL